MVLGKQFRVEAGEMACLPTLTKRIEVFKAME
jgi:hypothetical protein